MARTEREILELLKAQTDARKDLIAGSREYEEATKRIVALENEKVRLHKQQKKALKDGVEVNKEELTIYKQLEASIQKREKIQKKLTGDSSIAAQMQSKAAKQQGEHLQSLQKQMVNEKGNELKIHQAQYDTIESIGEGTNDIAGLNQLIAESKLRQKNIDHWSNKTIKDDEKNTENILKSEKRRMQAQSIQKSIMGKMDGLSGGMASKAKEFGKSMGVSPKNLAKLGIAGVIVGVLVKAATQFSKKIDQVGQTFGFITNQSPAFRNDLIDAGNEAMMVGKNLGDVLTVASTLSSEFGFALSETRDIADTVLDTAVATGLSTDEATKLFGTFMQIGNLTKDQAENEELLQMPY